MHLQGYRLFLEEICNEYAGQAMFFQSQVFLTEKGMIFLDFLISKKSQRSHNENHGQ